MRRLFTLLGLLFWMLLLTACGPSAGWRVSFGVAPVNLIDDRQELNPESKPKPSREY